MTPNQNAEGLGEPEFTPITVRSHSMPQPLAKADEANGLGYEIGGVRTRLTDCLNDATSANVSVDTGDLRAILADHARLKAREAALMEGLRPFAAMAKVLEARSRFSGGVASDSQIVADSVGEAGFGVLVIGHFRDAATLIPDAPAWSGLYRRSPLIQPRILTQGDSHER